MDTGRAASHTGVLGGNRGGTAGSGELRRDSMGRNTRYRCWGGRQQITLPCVYLCNCLACSAHVHQNLKCNKKNSVPLEPLFTFSSKISIGQGLYYSPDRQTSQSLCYSPEKQNIYIYICSISYI